MKVDTPLPVHGHSERGTRGDEATVSSPDRSVLRAAIVATALSLLLFLVIQTFLAAYNVEAVRDAMARRLYEPFPGDRISVFWRLFPSAIAGGLAFVTLALVGVLLAHRGHRLVFMVPTLAYVFAGVAMPGHVPEPLGRQWSLVCFSALSRCTTPWFGHPWVGSSIDAALVLIPGSFVARRLTRTPRIRPRDDAVVAARLACAAMVATAGWAIVVVQNGIDIKALSAVALMGLILGTPRPWTPWFQILVALVLGQTFAWILDFLVWSDPSYGLREALPWLAAETWPVIAVGVIASLWQPLAAAIRWMRARPIRLLIAVNALNLADAVMTQLAVTSGGALESNPVVRAVGLPAKILLVGALTALLFRRKPAAMVWPFVVLLWVVGYHVAGIFVNAWH